MLVLLGFCLYFGFYILWASFYFLATICLIDLIIFVSSLKLLDIQQTFPTHILYRNQKIDIKINLECNADFLKFTNYKAYYKNENDIFCEVSSTISLYPKEVGSFYFGVEHVVLKSFFKIFVTQYKLSEDYKSQHICLVLPVQKHLSAPVFSIRNLHDTGNNVNLKKGSDDFIGLRPYTSGDALNRVNYKKSSVLRKMLVNEFDDPNFSTSVNIIVENFSDENYSCIAESILAIYDYYLDTGADIVAVENSELLYSRNEHYDLSIDLAKKKIQSSTVPKTIENICAVIISEYDDERDFEFLGNLKSGSIILLISLGARHKETIIKKMRDLRINQINVLTELDLEKRAEL